MPVCSFNSISYKMILCIKFHNHKNMCWCTFCFWSGSFCLFHEWCITSDGYRQTRCLRSECHRAQCCAVCVGLHCRASWTEFTDRLSILLQQSHHSVCRYNTLCCVSFCLALNKTLLVWAFGELSHTSDGSALDCSLLARLGRRMLTLEKRRLFQSRKQPMHL